MAKIYISSTYSDLKDYREEVYRALRKLRHDVIAMEDYVATDQRPLDKCLNDVITCDIYVGIFAWRYGYIPEQSNPERKSITELEYRKAGEVGIPRLIFLLKDETPWSITLMDFRTGEGERGQRIETFRNELKKEETVSFFESPHHLAGLVSIAVQKQIGSAVAIAEPLVEETAKEIKKDFQRYCKLRTLVEEIGEEDPKAKNRLDRIGADFKNIYAQVLETEQAWLLNKSQWEDERGSKDELERRLSALTKKMAVLKFDFYSGVGLQIEKFEKELNLVLKNEGVPTTLVAAQAPISEAAPVQKIEIPENKREKFETIAEIMNETREKIGEAGASEPVGDPETYNRLGYFYVDGNRWLKAQEYFEKALVIDPNYATAWSNLGAVYAEQKNYAEAIRHYKKALEIDPNFALVWYNLGNAYYYQENYAEAISSFKKVLEIDPNYMVAWSNLGNIYYYQENYAEAISSFKKALEIDLNDATAWSNLGAVYAEQKNYAEAIRHYKKALEIDPNFALAWYNLGNAYYYQENYAEAISSYKKALEIDPNYTAAWGNLGNAYYYQENYAEAISSFKKVLEIDPNDAKAWYNLGNIYKTQGNEAEATKCFNNAKLIRPR